MFPVIKPEEVRVPDDILLPVAKVVALSAVPANGCLYVDNISNLLVVSLLANCAVLRDDSKLRDVILSVTNETGCLYVDNIPILLVVYTYPTCCCVINELCCIKSIYHNCTSII